MLVPGANTGILVSRRNRSSETKHEWPGRQGAGARSGRETGFEKSLSPPKTNKRDTDLPQCFSSGDSGRRASGSPAVCAQVSTGPKMRGRALIIAADDTPAPPQRRRPLPGTVRRCGPAVVQRSLPLTGMIHPPGSPPKEAAIGRPTTSTGQVRLARAARRPGILENGRVHVHRERDVKVHERAGWLVPGHRPARASHRRQSNRGRKRSPPTSSSAWCRCARK